MASSICSFNLAEVCETAIGLLKDPDSDICRDPERPGFSRRRLHPLRPGGTAAASTRPAGAASGSGDGTAYDKASGCIEITEIPPTTTVEAIIDKIVELVKAGKIREIADIRDETDLAGLKIAIETQAGRRPGQADGRSSSRMTPLEDSYSCNFNVLIAGTAQGAGRAEGILLEWIALPDGAASRRRVDFDLKKAKDKLHLLQGLAKILLDIDKAIRIVRETEEEAEVVPNLMIGFGIDEIQAEYVAEIKLRHLNREYILNRTRGDPQDLENAIAEMQDILGSPREDQQDHHRRAAGGGQKIRPAPEEPLFIYADELARRQRRGGSPGLPGEPLRHGRGVFQEDHPPVPADERRPEAQGRGRSDLAGWRRSNSAELLFFTDHAQVYKAKAADFSETKASVMGDYLASKLGFDEGEHAGRNGGHA